MGLVNDDVDFSDLLQDVPVNESQDDDQEEIVEKDPLGLEDFYRENGISVPEEQEQEENDDEDSNEAANSDEDFIIAYLKENGINDPSKLQYSDDEGNISEVDFNSLSNAEKLNIIKEISNPGLSDYEQQVVQFIRDNGSLDQIIKYYQDQAVNAYLNEHPEDIHTRQYEIDDYTDDELYLANLKMQYPDFSDEELYAKLDSAKINEDLFTKETATLRQRFKEQEDEMLQQQRQQEEYQNQVLQQELQSKMQYFTEIALDPDDPETDFLSVEDEDRNIMLRYLLETGSDGKSQLLRDMEDPQALAEIAYYRTRERDNLTGLTRYWKAQLAEERKEKAKLQKELDKYKNKGKNSFVVNENKAPKSNRGKIKTVQDLY